MEKSSTEKSGIISKIIVSLMVGVMAGLIWGLIVVAVAKNVFEQSLEYWSMFRWIGGIFFVVIFIGWFIKDALAVYKTSN